MTVTTFQSAADDSEAKSNELTRAVDELHKLLKEAGEANKTIQDHLLQVEESKDQMEKEMLEKIGKLEKELENANDLLSATKRKGVAKRHFLVPRAARTYLYGSFN